jgi:PAS domain S-box-containing protein
VAHFDARWQSPETLQAIFDQISDGVFFYDKNLHLVSVNKSGEKMLGLSADEMLGQHYSTLFRVTASAQNGDSAPSNQSAALPTGTLTLLLENGRERLVVVRSIELLDQKDCLEGVVATVTDVSDIAFHVAGDRNGGSRFRPPAKKYHPIVIRNRRVAAALGGLLLLFIVVLAASVYFGSGKQLTPEERRLMLAEKDKREAAVRFNAMTPAQHIEGAKLALRPGATPDAIAEGLRHLKVIPASSPEAARAGMLQKDLAKAGSLASAQTLIDAASNADVHDGMEKLQRAEQILDSVAQQYPKDKDASEVSRSVQSAAEQLAMRFPQEFASAETKLVDFTWEKGGFGTVMMANFTIRNDSPVDVADFKIRCEHLDSNGVVVDQNSGTAFGIVKAHATIRISSVNMGFLNPQTGTSRTAKTNCEILGLKAASESQALSSTR